MKLAQHGSGGRHLSGVMLIECLVYIAVFGILLGIATLAFYFCWDHTRAVMLTADDVESALRAGETWRADVRAATGPITVETTAAGEIVKIPGHERDIVYRYAGGELCREIPSQNFSRVVLLKVKNSDMKAESRPYVSAWRWNLQLTPRRNEGPFPSLFTFEAVSPKL
jgi:hypothetical protein